MYTQEWYPLKGYEGLYEIRKEGEIRSLHKRNYQKHLATRIDRAGYYTLRLSKAGITATKYLHRLLAETFIDNPERTLHVNHKNGNKLDNSLPNLEWITHQENVRHAYQLGLNSSAKKVIDILTGVTFISISQAAHATGVNYNTCCKWLEKKQPNFRLQYIR